LPSGSSRARLARAAVAVTAAVAATVAATMAAEPGARPATGAARTILDLQPLRSASSAAVEGAGGQPGTATLVNLNPNVNAWYVLSVDWSGAPAPLAYHLENPRADVPLTLARAGPQAIRIAAADGRRACTLELGASGPLPAATRSGLPYAPLCDGLLYLRNPVAGNRSSIERVTDFLRDHVWGGERIMAFAKEQIFRDAFLEKGEPVAAPAALPPAGGPAPAAIDDAWAERALVPEHLGIRVAGEPRALLPGRWYPLADLGGVYLSVMAAEAVAARILLGHERGVNPLDRVESAALVYLVAFDLGRFDLHFTLGTDHPRLDWSDRPPASVRDPALPGPDGIASAAPLVRTGMVSPAEVARTLAAFTGGFKREHGAFRFGELAERNHGSHYGFVEQGTVFSTLQPGLATVVVMDDGRVELGTWTGADDATLARVRFARQNGVPLVEFDAARGVGVPGELVNLWGPGNWSGSAKEDARTLRAGLCLQQNDTRRFLVYGYFSSATPSAMARVFQAYRCRYAMHLDMNALEHTYLALYLRRGQQRLLEHLVEGMEVLDRESGNGLAPRFIAFPDNRDFFFLTYKVPPP
jgi:hypothetical protein